ncbi:hypothetical protein [Microvirga pakistanensis]|uniref:hypothetical protein n=1 Tax=Microvirga pakistanensis TaxID=1682650 RepID=UPI00106B6A09|nr:hypothetical protein [Microvirga pakistanensis]
MIVVVTWGCSLSTSADVSTLAFGLHLPSFRHFLEKLADVVAGNVKPFCNPGWGDRSVRLLQHRQNDFTLVAAPNL